MISARKRLTRITWLNGLFYGMIFSIDKWGFGRLKIININMKNLQNWIGGIWLLINIPIVPFVGSILHQLPASLHLIVSLIVLAVFTVLSKSLSASVVASICVVAIALLRLEQVQNYLQSGDVNSVTSPLILVIVIALIAVGAIVYKIVKTRV